MPIGVAVGRNPVFSKWVRPIVQFCAAFPVILILRFHLSINIWSTVLIMMGAQPCGAGDQRDDRVCAVIQLVSLVPALRHCGKTVSGELGKLKVAYKTS